MATGEVLPKASAHREHGFTLVEVLVTLAIAALVGVIALPSLDRAEQRSARRAGVARVNFAFAETRAAALRSGGEVVLASAAAGRALMSAGTPWTLPAGNSVILRPDPIHLFPDGSGSGGTIHLSSPDGEAIWTIDPASGAIRGPGDD